MLGQFKEAIQFFLSQYHLKLLHPEGLLLLLGVPVFVLLGLWMGRDLRWYRRLWIQLLRAALLTALAVALSRPVQVSRQNTPAVALLADLSDSMAADVRKDMQQRLQELWSQRGGASTFLVGFGRQPSLLAGPESRRVALPPATTGSEATDIATALRFTYDLFPPLHDRRVVVFTDGDETRGSFLSEAISAHERGIEVSTVAMLPSSTVDARLEGVSVPALARMGDPLALEVEVTSSARQGAALRLIRDGEQLEQRQVVLEKGANRFPFSLTFDREGWHTLNARVFPRRDRYPQNNWAAARVFVTGRPKVLLVQKKDEPNPLRTLLQGQKVQLETATPESMPESLQALSEKDLIVLDDLALGKLPAEVVSRLRAYVEEFGGGLLVTTGPEASELAGPEDLPIETLLPVTFRQVKKKEEIPAALVFVLDRSSSMERGEKFVILLRAVADTLDRLRDTAQVSAVMFDDFPEVVVPLTEAKNREQVRKVLLSQRVGGGTSMYPALEEAHKQLKKSAAKLKHVILLSDGQSITLFDHFGYVVEAMAKDKITVTAVALGKDADQEELKRVAATSGGHFYFTDSISNVPKIFTAETENITQSNVVEQPVQAVPAKLVQALAGIDFSRAPPLKGYIASEPRPTSEVLLNSTDRGEPVLARWRFGLGKVMLLTTDAQGAWCGAWTSWDGFGKLWPQLVDDTLRRSPPGEIRLEGKVEEERAVLTVRVPAEKAEDATPPPKLLSLDPSGHATELTLTRRGLGIYRGEMPLLALGAYAFQAERIGRRGAREVDYTSLCRTYPEEYLSASGNPQLLQAVALATGGESDPNARVVFAPGRQERQRQQEHWPPFVFLAIGLFLVEVFFRRF